MLQVVFVFTVAVLAAIPVFGTLWFGSAKLKNRRRRFWQPLWVGLRFSRFRRQLVIHRYLHVAAVVFAFSLYLLVSFLGIQLLFETVPQDESGLSVALRTILLLGVLAYGCLSLPLVFGRLHRWFMHRVFPDSPQTTETPDADFTFSWREQCVLVLWAAFALLILVGVIDFEWLQDLNDLDGRTRRTRAISNLAKFHAAHGHWETPAALALLLSSAGALLYDLSRRFVSSKSAPVSDPSAPVS